MSAHDMILYWASVNYHPLYERYILEEYEKENGCHFNEEYARKAVEGMYSICESGEKHRGEHWSIDEVRSAISRYDIGEENTIWDAYVALNMWWHDLHTRYKKHYSSYEEYLIEDAVTWAFCDDDAPEGKVWKYIHAMC